MLARQRVICQEETGMINPIDCSGGAEQELQHVKDRPQRSLKPETAYMDCPRQLFRQVTPMLFQVQPGPLQQHELTSSALCICVSKFPWAIQMHSQGRDAWWEEQASFRIVQGKHSHLNGRLVGRLCTCAFMYEQWRRSPEAEYWVPKGCLGLGL